MLEFLKFVFSHFWAWLGFIIVFLSIIHNILTFITTTFELCLIHRRIMKYGYPPEEKEELSEDTEEEK